MVSIIMPVYNGEKYLADSIEAVLCQNFSDFELILVDDGSRDGSASICNDYAEKDSRVVVIHTENHGVSAARRCGYEKAKGEWITFMDDDDIVVPWYLSCMLEHSDGYDIVAGGGSDLPSAEVDKLNFEKITLKQGKEYEFSGAQAAQLLNTPNDSRFGIVTLLWGKIIRRTVMEKVIQLIDEYREVIPFNYFEDIFVVPRLFLNAEKILIWDKLIYYHRNCADSPSHTMHLRKYNYEQIEVVNLNLQYYKKLDYTALYQGQLPHGYLVMLKIWYACMKCEQDSEQVAWCDERIHHYFDYYYEGLKRNPYMNFSYKCVIYLFRINKKVWSFLVGDLYFNFLYKYRTLFVK